MRTIYKYALMLDQDNYLDVDAASSRPVLFAMQNGTPTLWLEIEAGLSAGPTEGYPLYRIYGTGHRLYPDGTPHHHIGSCMDGPYVWHLYRVG